MATMEDVISSLRNTNLSPKGVSFQGKSLKLDTAADAKIVVEAINNCEDLEFLNLEGNTLGVQAAQAIANALKFQSKFKRALWKDMFTGRMKTEIPKALEYLGEGIVKAGTLLTELDLSDNAFGPTGVKGLAFFLRSSSCYALETLRLNNNGLGIIGGKLLAEALLDCYRSSKAVGKPLGLKVFNAGRNRLENEGAKALAEVFKTLGTLEEIVMPQNGIYHIGISALSASFMQNEKLENLNLNDNTIGPKGAAAISKILPVLPKLKQINFGDCLLKTQGALLLATSLHNIVEVEELILGFNEIQIEGALAIIDTLGNKRNLHSLILDGNQFNKEGKKQIEERLKQIGKYNVLGSLDECESEAENTESEDDDNIKYDNEEQSYDDSIFEVENSTLAEISFNDFIINPSSENFLRLGSDIENVIQCEITKSSESYLDVMVPTLMKISALIRSTHGNVNKNALKCTESLYKQLFLWAQTNDSLSLVNNALLVHLGLIKSEDKQFELTWDVRGCFLALENIIGKNYIPEATKNCLQIFVQKDIDKNVDLVESKQSLIKILG